MTACELVELLSSNRFFIFGTGYVAERFFCALRDKGLLKFLSGFITSERKQTDYFGYKVYSIIEYFEEYEANSSHICIAVHESNKAEIENVLNQYGIRNYVWIYPFLFRLLLGNPMLYNQDRLVDSILCKQNNDYGIAVRLLAIDDFYKKNDYGFQIYKKYLRIQWSENTSNNRINQFIDLINNWDLYGYNKSIPIDIMENNIIVDGRHRFSLACYHGMNNICCNVFSANKSFYEIHKEEGMLTPHILYAGSYDAKEIEIIENAMAEILKRYGLRV